jgi:hypothetical protein
LDYNRDGIGDACDPDPQLDSDGDGIPNNLDDCPYLHDTDDEPCPATAVEIRAPDFDYDGDGIPTGDDNCPSMRSHNRLDRDCDGLGDACDANTNLTDTDRDGVFDGCDNCRYFFNPYLYDADGVPYQPDYDGDGVGDACDNCCALPNTGQNDADRDGIGDHCDTLEDDPHNQPRSTGGYYCPYCYEIDSDAENPACGNANHMHDWCEPDADRDGVPNCDDPYPLGDENGQFCIRCQPKETPPVRRFETYLNDPCPCGPQGECAITLRQSSGDYMWINRVEVQEVTHCAWIGYGAACEPDTVCECSASGNWVCDTADP